MSEGMNLSDVREYIRKNYISDKQCPVCKGETTMIQVEYWPDDDKEMYCNTVWRCLRCLNLFKEELSKVELKKF